MMSEEQNRRITRVGPGTPGGNLLRQYWIPAALAEELNGDRALVAVRLMGESLVLFRADDGALGLIARHCPHRGADLFYGRLEDGGLRCAFHGWKFGIDGQCQQQPAEPEGSGMAAQIKTAAYPVVERNGVIFAYLGAGAPPAFPDFDCFRAPDSHVFAFKGLWRCNWLQALEVGIDPAHASYLHRFFKDEDPSDQYGKQFRDKADGADLTLTQVLREHDQPTIKADKTEYGLRITTLRDLGDGQRHVRITNQVFPCAVTIPMSNEMNITQWHVPVDDENCYWYAMFTSFAGPVDKLAMRAQRLAEHTLPDYAPIRNKGNNYGFDAEEQKTLTYTGMGLDINVHDQWACESMGPIQDRTKEHLATTDRAISSYRRLLMQAIDQCEKGETDLIGRPDADAARAIRGPIAVDAVGPAGDDEKLWTAKDRLRRENCPWDASL
jgi:nitrite reductase/ring-hydroxylating ferredoxin subunit